VDQPLTDRRIDARFPPGPGATRATLRPGCPVVLVDVSAGGALVEASRPLRPGARVHLQLVTGARNYALAAHVLRCAVWSLDPYDGVTYRGALMFEDRCELVWEAETPAVSAIPAGPQPDGDVSGRLPPAARASEYQV
jgi:hypothetical protein